MKAPRFTLFGFRRPREAACRTLGRLEREVLEEAWRRGEVSVGEVHQSFGERVAYTTLMTTLDRLFKKNLLDRRRAGRAFLYSPRITREEFERHVAEDIIDGLLDSGGGGGEPLLACIVDTVSERDRELLDTLYRLVREKRHELRRGGEEG